MKPSTMRALVYEGPRIMNVRQQDVPTANGLEVLIRIEKAGICGSELSGYLGQNSLRTPPLVMGHEFSGTVVEIGDDVTKFRQGDRVTANPLIACGSCRSCHNGHGQLCENRSLIGAHRPGAFAEYVLVPESNIYKLQDHVSFEEGAMTEPFACAVHICRMLELTAADRLLIIGAGPIGLFTLQAAQIFGLQEIVVVDLNEERLDIASELGGMTVTHLNQLEKSRQTGFDAAVDAVGVGMTRTQCVESVRSGGKVVFSGLHEAESSLPINLAIRNEVAMFGAFAYTPNHFEQALRLIEEGKINMMPWTTIAPLEEGGPCFEKLLNDPGKVAKILLTV